LRLVCQARLFQLARSSCVGSNYAFGGNDEEIARLLWGENPAEQLLKAALDNGGQDNVTLLVLELRV